MRAEFIPEAYLRPADQAAAARLRDGYSGPIPCAYEKTEMGIPEIASLPTDQCFKMTKPQRMTGLWRNEFEGQAFCAGRVHECPGQWRPNEPGVAWIDFATPLSGSADTPPGGLYAIDFIGRATAYPGRYGGYDFYNQEVIVDRVLSITEVEAPPPPPPKEEEIRYFKKCERAKTCIPNWSEINGMDDAQIKKAHIDSYRAECSRHAICMPNSAVKTFK